MHRPCLAPGAPVLRTDIRRVQIGNPALIIMTDSPGLFSALQSLDGSRTWAEAISHIHTLAPTLNAENLLAALAQHGAIVDSKVWDLPNAELRAAAIALGSSAVHRLTVRRRSSVSVTSDGPSHGLARRLAQVLRASGVTITRSDAPGVHWRIVVCDGEPPRSALNLLHDQGSRFCVLSILPHQARWGPAVDPNVTPCWKCFDAHMTERNRYWQVLCTQFGPATNQAAIDTLTAGQQARIIGHVADDVCQLLDTGTSDAIGAVMTYLDESPRLEFGFHPQCDCSLLGSSIRSLS